jgi:hypothetical protein
LLKEAHPGIQINNAFLGKVLEHKQATYSTSKEKLAEVRINFPLASQKSQKAIQEDLQALFVATFCVKELEGLRREVVTHLQSNAIALSPKKQFWEYKFTGLLVDWKFPSRNGASEECSLVDWDYRQMDKVNFKKRVYRCSLCESFWTRGWFDFRWSTCMACKKFSARANKPFRPGTEIVSTMPIPPEPEPSSSIPNQNNSQAN